MSRRGLVLWGAVFATGVAAAALTVPALADTTAKNPPPGQSGQVGMAGADSAPEVRIAIERDLGIDAAQADARLSKEAWARGTAARLRRSLGAQFAGAWLTGDAKQLMVGVTSSAAAATVRSAGATPKQVGRNETALAAVKTTLDRAGSISSTAVAGWYVDVADNQVDVVARPGGEAAANAWLARSGVTVDSVRVTVADEQPKPLFDVRGGDPYFIDNQFRCSVGFSVTIGFVTAGHCGQVGSTTKGFNQQAQGTFVASSFPGNNDFGVVKVNGNWTPQPVVNDFNGGTVPVAGSQEAPVGASICRTGSTTGTHCGVIQAKNQTVNYPEGSVTGLTRTNVCAEGGDSGGSWLSGDQAQGVTSGGSGNCTQGGITFFQPVNEILQANNLTLVTTAGGGGSTTPPSNPPGSPAPNPTATPTTGRPAPTPSASSPSPAPGNRCAGLPASGTGSLTAGHQQVRPTSGFFRANAGKHVGCLSGPADANFDLTLDKWNGKQWRTVATSAGPGAQEQVTFNGSAGFYRYRVIATTGSGAYTIAAALP
jgi:streptogrisin C